MEISQIIHTSTRFLLRPIVSEWTLFFLFIILISFTTIKGIAAHFTDWEMLQLSFSYLSLSTLIAYIFTSIVYISKSSKIKLLVYTIGILLFATTVFLWLVFGTSLSPLIIQILFETNKRESCEFISAFLFTPNSLLSVVITGIMIICIWLVEKYKESIITKLKIIFSPLFLLFAKCFILLVLISGLWKAHIIYYSLLKTRTTADLEQWAGNHYAYYQLDAMTTLVYSLHSLTATGNDLKIARQRAFDTLKEKSAIKEDTSLTVIYILGESYIKTHAGIYGYSNQTTPHLNEEKAKGNLFVFNNVNSPFNNTTQAEKHTFSCNSIAAGEQWYEQPFFPTIFKQAGYNVYFWDIQRNWENNSVPTFSVNIFLYDKTISSLSYTQVNTKQFVYDGDMVHDFYQADRTDGKYNLVIFHLIAQHVTAQDRYPHDGRFNIFSSKDIKSTASYLTEEMKQTIAHYDNATYYNDYVISQIIKQYIHKNAVMVYLSDHGEEVYDWRPSKGRSLNPMCANVAKYQFEIPFTVWCSDLYKKYHPQTIKALETSVNRPMSSDNVCHLLFHLGRVDSRYYIASRDILSTQYKKMRRTVAEHYNYDKIRFGE